jgi:hypothetical protein
MSFSKALKSFVPKPSPYELIRIGGDADGAYLLPNDLEGITACFSPGVFNRKDFEDELAARFNIRSHMCDLSSDEHLFKTPIIEGMQTFKKLWLDISGEQSISLADWVAQQEPGREGDFILQMDIEGAEYRNLIDTPVEVLDRFRIIVIEIHKLAVFDVQDRTTAARKVKHAIRVALSRVWLPLRRLTERLPRGWLARKLSRLLASNEPYLATAVAEKLSKTHVCVHAHANNWAGDYVDPTTGMNVPRILELTFLRKDRFVGEKTRFHAPQIPHPLDIVNVPEKPPVPLNPQWAAGATMLAR